MKERILLVSSGGLKKSGVPSVMMTVVEGLSDRYCFDILLHSRTTDYFESRFLACGGRVFRFPKKHFGFKPLDRIAEVLRPLELYRFTRKLIRKNGPYKAIHCNNDFDSSGCVSAAKKESIPIRICHTHKSWNPDSETGIITRLYRKACRKAILSDSTALIGCSSYANLSSFGKDSNAGVLLNPYDEKRFSPSLPLNNPPGLNMIQVGYFSPLKNQLFTVEVFKKLKESRPDAHLTLVGDRSGEYGQRVENALNESGLGNAVTLLPADADIPKEMEKSSILILPSKSEGFGIVLVEAQAMGLHCFASDSVPKETDRGGVRFLSLSDGADAWAEAILSVKSLLDKKVQDCSVFSTESFLKSVDHLYSGT